MSKLHKLFIALLVTMAAALFAAVIFPFLFMVLVLVFAIRTLNRWRETNFTDEEFD